MIKTNYDKTIEWQRRSQKKAIENQRKRNLEKLKAGTLYKKRLGHLNLKKTSVPADIKSIKKELDRLWSLKVREKCQCELCGRKGDIKSFDAHHIKRRSHLLTRWDLNNGACLCKGCHRFGVHIDTLKANQLIENLKQKRGDQWYKDLVERSNQIVKYTKQDLIDLINNYER